MVETPPCAGLQAWINLATYQLDIQIRALVFPSTAYYATVNWSFVLQQLIGQLNGEQKIN